jgi:hypothetical protein
MRYRENNLLYAIEKGELERLQNFSRITILASATDRFKLRCLNHKSFDFPI